jgi:hypothetical protein
MIHFMVDDPASAAASAVTWAWNQQSVWSQASSRLKTSLFRARSAALGLTIAAAVLVTAAAQVAELSSFLGQVLAWSAAVCASLAALVQTMTGRDRVQSWTRTRSVSEAFKSEIYTFLAGVAPYRGPDRIATFKRLLDGVLEDASELIDQTIGIEPAARSLPPVTDLPTYLTERVQKQSTGYYRPKSAIMKRRASRFRWAQIALSVLAALLSAGAAVSGLDGLAIWLPVITTIAAAVAAETAVQRFDALALEYARTHVQLERLLRDRAVDGGSGAAAADDAFVQAVEQVISTQNEAWMARGVAVAGPEVGAAGGQG